MGAWVGVDPMRACPCVVPAHAWRCRQLVVQGGRVRRTFGKCVLTGDLCMRARLLSCMPCS
eukprot:1322824-Lingulodinium_polyedra.AAC.1